MLRAVRRGNLEPGELFARDFRVERRLSEGGMGAVYVARQLSTGKLRALKLMHPQLVPDAKSRARFVEEARIGARIASEHIVEVVAAGVDEESGAPWLAMELLDGEDLFGAVERRGPLPPADVREVFLQLGHALAAAHSQGIIHRDLKPENLFIARALRQDAVSTVKVLDFGIAMSTPASGRAVVTTAMGSPFWMAPEQARTGDTLDPSTDVWALGLIAFYLLSGVIYWRTAHAEHAAATAVLVEILMDPLDPPTQRAAEFGSRGWLPPGFDEWFAHCVNRDPSARFREAGAAVRALTGLLASAGASSSTLSLAATAPAGADPAQVQAAINARLPATRASGVAALQTSAPSHATDAPAPTGRRWLGAAVGAALLCTVIAGGAGWWLAGHGTPAQAPTLTPLAPTPAPLALPTPSAPLAAPPSAAVGALAVLRGIATPSPSPAASHHLHPGSATQADPAQPTPTLPAPTLPTPTLPTPTLPTLAPTPVVAPPPQPVAAPQPAPPPEPIPGTLELTASEPCSAWVDGRAVGGTPLRTPLLPGEHIVRVRHAPTGFEETLEVQILAGQTSSRRTNVPVPAPAPPVVAAVAPAPVAPTPPSPPRAYRVSGQMDHRAGFTFEEATRGAVGARCRDWKDANIAIAGFVDSVIIDGRERAPGSGFLNTNQACDLVARQAEPVP